MPSADVTTIVLTLIAALPDACLRDLCLQLVLNSLATPPPATPAETQASRPRGRPRAAEPRVPRRRGRPPGTGAPAKKSVDPKLAARRKRYEAKRAVARQAAKTAKVAAQTNGNGEGVAVSPQAFWQHAEKLEPTRPWLAVTREFDVKEAIAQNCYRKLSLPPSIGPMAITKFLTLPAPA
jgi:hypothetical protein